MSKSIFAIALVIGACVDNEPSEVETVAAGSGSGSACQPRLDLTLDQSALAVDTGTTAAIQVRLTSTNYYAGTVTLSATLHDPLGGTLAGWTVALDNSKLMVPYNGVATTFARVTVPADAIARAGTARIAITSGAPSSGNVIAEATLVTRDVVTFTITNNTGQCVYPAPGATTNVRIGTKLRWLNSPSSSDIIYIHVDNGAQYGVAHQSTNEPGLAPGAIFEQTVMGVPGSPFRWYCHYPGPFTNNWIQPVN